MTYLKTDDSMGAQHTAGPWAVRRWSKSESAVVAHINGKDVLITGYALHPDARLIAAAPELLEALEECATLLRNLCPRIPHDGPRSEQERVEYETIGGTFSHAERVIAKARGAAA